jgi:hypothetical protein
MVSQADHWHRLASRLEFDVIAPAIILVGSASITFTALLPQFGCRCGMIVDPDWNVIEPNSEKLMQLGYGYSAVEIGSNSDDQSAKEMLRDWGWSSEDPRPAWW